MGTSELREIINISKEAAQIRNRGQSMPLAHNPDDVCGPDLPCCPGSHCNPHAGHCMAPPGAHGPTCDVPIAFDAASLFVNTSTLGAAANVSETRLRTARVARNELSLFAARWAKSYVRAKVRATAPA